ncbi:hypothetical protein [Pengzhenrongella sp.]|jgi:hypothetical protein|uniref:hypothetical protein n=1 Tax=Pengzhenrongella sp. TaxID=2888820 RepID=UPI002F92F00A
MTTTNGTTEVWQARIGHDFAAELHADADVLGLRGRTDIVRAALAMLHASAAEQRMANDVREFYGDETPPLPIGVLPAPPDAVDAGSADVTDAHGSSGSGPAAHVPGARDHA